MPLLIPTSTAYVHIKKDKRHGLSPHMEKLIFVGYPAQYKGWEFYNPVTRRFVLSDRADFDERDCPGTADFKADQIVFAPPTPPAPGLQDLAASEVPDQVGDMPHLVGANQPPPGTPSASSDSDNTSAPHSPSYSPTPAPASHSPTPASSHSNSSSSSTNLPASSPSPTPSNPEPPAPRPARVRTNPKDWKSNWYKANYKPAAARDPDDYREPTPAIPDSESDSEPISSPDSDSDPDYVPPKGYLTVQEALHCAYSAVAKSTYC